MDLIEKVIFGILAIIALFFLWFQAVIQPRALWYVVPIFLSWLLAMIITSLVSFSASLPTESEKRSNFSWAGVLVTIFLAVEISKPIPYLSEQVDLLGLKWEELLILTIVFFAFFRYTEVHKNLRTSLSKVISGIKYFRGAFSNISEEIKQKDELYKEYVNLNIGMVFPILLSVPFLVNSGAFDSLGGIIYGALFIFSGEITLKSATAFMYEGKKNNCCPHAASALFRVYLLSLLALIIMVPVGLTLKMNWFNQSTLNLGTGILLLVVAFLFVSPKSTKSISHNILIFLLVGIISITIVKSINVYPHPVAETISSLIVWLGLFSLLKFNVAVEKNK